MSAKFRAVSFFTHFWLTFDHVDCQNNMGCNDGIFSSRFFLFLLVNYENIKSLVGRFAGKSEHNKMKNKELTSLFDMY